MGTGVVQITALVVALIQKVAVVGGGILDLPPAPPGCPRPSRGSGESKGPGARQTWTGVRALPSLAGALELAA